MLKVSFHTLGCKVNQYETDAMIELFQQRGYQVVDFNEPADVCIINTCTVTNIADKKSRKMLSKAKKTNQDSVVVAIGCYAQIAENHLKDHSEVDLIIGTTNKSQIVDRVEDYLREHKQSIYIEDLSSDISYEEMWISKVDDRKRAHIKIQDGCNQFCSYCIIPYTRGRVRSRTPENVLNEVSQLAQKGYKEVVLTGIHLASYGIEFDNYMLIHLLKELNEVNGLERIRLGSLEPTLITKEFVDAIVKLEKVCPHFHLSLQSGSDAILKRMNRKYTTNDYLQSVEYLKSAYDQPAITTDIIVGFPGETEEEFEQTCSFMEKVGFADLHVFKYSKREGTKAAGMNQQVPEQIKNERSNILSRIRNELNKKYLSSLVGKTLEVIFEETITENAIQYVYGHAANYMRVRVVQPDYNIERQLESVYITNICEDFLEGSLVNFMKI
jgi:threonylcarbamoyladenosine tRNA methylthiotransferase MtaB